MPAYKMLALDMDGTLLTSDKRISPRTAKAIRRAAEAGYVVVLSTGRTASELTDYRAEMDGVVRYGSLLSGGVVRDMETGETIYKQTIPVELVHRIVKQGLAEDAMVQILTSEVAVMTHRDVARMPEIGQGVYQDIALRLGCLVDDISSYVDAHAAEVCKFNLHHVSQESLEATLRALEGLPLQLAKGESITVEVTPRGVTKALGLTWLCDHLGIGLEETIVVGDGDNDLEVLGVAGLAVAMGNAVPKAMELADAVVADNDHDGIAEVVDRWLVGPSEI